jgi:isocitrate dehydrogenase kinase/phosphatase
MRVADDVSPLELAEYQQAARQVLRHPLITASYPDKAVLPLARKWARQLRADFAEVLGYTLVSTGETIRLRAYTNIFPGDLLLKNFGVTRHGRVIFYDYDELCSVTDCNFRDVPQASNAEDEMRAEAWFYVADNDVFPETFINFLAFSVAQREALLRVHGEILTAAFWRGVQQRLRECDVLEVLPYHPHRVRVAGSL